MTAHPSRSIANRQLPWAAAIMVAAVILSIVLLIAAGLAHPMQSAPMVPLAAPADVPRAHTATETTPASEPQPGLIR